MDLCYWQCDTPIPAEGKGGITMYPGVSPIAFYVGPWPVHWYGIIFAFVITIGTLLAANDAKRRGEDPQKAWDGVLLVIFLGLVGGRLYHVIHEWNALYKDNPIAVFYIWNGGLAIYGGIAGGALGLALFARSNHVNLLRWMDIVAPSLILGQAIGRWGNFINQELYGTPTNLPWAVYIDPQHRLPGYENIAYYQPLFLYESLWDLFVFGILIYLTRRSHLHMRDGDVIFLYLILYSIGRFFLEGIKIGDVFTVFGIRTAQLIAVVAIACSAAILIYRRRRAEAPHVVHPEA